MNGEDGNRGQPLPPCSSSTEDHPHYCVWGPTDSCTFSHWTSSWIQMTKDFFFPDRATYRLWRTFPRSIPAHIHFWYPGLLQDQVEITWRGRDRVEAIQHKMIPLSPASPPDASCFPKLLSWEQTALSARTAQGSCKLRIDWSQPYQIFEMRMLSVVHTL